MLTPPFPRPPASSCRRGAAAGSVPRRVDALVGASRPPVDGPRGAQLRPAPLYLPVPLRTMAARALRPFAIAHHRPTAPAAPWSVAPPPRRFRAARTDGPCPSASFFRNRRSRSRQMPWRGTWSRRANACGCCCAHSPRMPSKLTLHAHSVSVSELQMSLNVSNFMDVVRVLGQSSVGQRHAPDTLESFTVPSGLTSNNSIKVPTRDERFSLPLF